MIFLSVIIPAFNEAKRISNTISRIEFALKAQIVDLDWEVIVCDNNSSDQTALIARQAGAIVIFEPVHQISRARNTGAGIAKGEWLLFIDADTYPLPELIGEVIELINKNTCVGCGSTIKVEGGSLFNKLRMERLNPFFRLFGFSGGAFLLCRKDAYSAIGGFSTKLYALEEIDFVAKLKKFGRKKGLSFHVLHTYPVITSGRKGDYTLFSMINLVISDIFAVVLFIVYKIMPATLLDKLAPRLLGYWYNQRNQDK